MVNHRSFFFIVLIAVVLFVVVTSNLPFHESGSIVQASPDPGQPIERSGILHSRQNSVDHAFLYDADQLPLMIRWSNWRSEFGPAYVYARESDLEGMLNMNAPVAKMLMVASYDEVERLMERSSDLHVSGITIVGLNTEYGPGMTPPDEMETLNDPDPKINIVARVARLVNAHGFELMWGPVRRNADAISDATARTLIASGVQGLALQEQKFIEDQPALSRLNAVQQTRERYLRLARDVGISDFSFHVQIMHQRCPDLSNCVSFVQMLEAIPIESIAIWSNGPIPVDFVSSIREGQNN